MRKYGKSRRTSRRAQRRNFRAGGRSKEQKQAMQQFFNSVKDNKDDAGNKKKFDELLHAGKGKIKKTAG